MILFYINTANKNYARIIRDLYRSCPEEKMLKATSRFAEVEALNERADIIVFAGMIRGEGLIYNYCKEKKKNFLYIDHAYLNRGYNAKSPENEWLRITYNSFTWNKFRSEPSTRWDTYFANSFKLAPWRSNEGKHILVLPPSEATKYLFPESADWNEKMVDFVKERIDAPIKIRQKPDQPRIDKTTNQVVGRLNIKHSTTIDQDLLDAKYVIAFNSAVPVQATLMGIPCICSSESAAYPISIDLNKLEDPPEPNRQEWLNQLVCHQYTSAEINSGAFWSMIKRYIREQ